MKDKDVSETLRSLLDAIDEVWLEIHIDGRIEREEALVVAVFERWKPTTPIHRYPAKELIKRLRRSHSLRPFVSGDGDTVRSALQVILARNATATPSRRLLAPNDYPTALQHLLHRRIWPSTVKRVCGQTASGQAACFVKPARRTKSFTGFICRHEGDIEFFDGAGGNNEVWCSEVVEWVSEYRVYVYGDRVLSVEHYDGAPERRYAPNLRVVQAAVEQLWKSSEATAARVLDFGLMRHPRLGTFTALVEANDAFAVGAYGALSDERYTLLLLARWLELTPQHPQ